MEIRYNPEEIELKWQKYWEKNKTFKAEKDTNKKKYYLLEMFPYPSGKIHIGHIRNYAIGDVIARYKRMLGYNVMHPMGWDAFGMPAENAAIENNTHPTAWTYSNIEAMRNQLKRAGFSYDWSRELATCSPEYYKWEQALFLKMYEAGMAYRKESYVNWCEKCQTVLANEQVESGACWRCKEPVMRKKLNQWFFSITDYAQELLDYCDKLSGWPQKVTLMQKNWIGKSIGATIKFPLEHNIKEADNYIEVFTTRQDTVFGATFMCLAPEHPLVEKLAKGTSQEKAINKFIEKTVKSNRTDKDIEKQEKEGVFTGQYAINPFTQKKMPIYTANFALMEYGTGAVMSVPAHDQRDFEFAKKYNLEIVVVIEPENKKLDPLTITEAYIGEGILVNSGKFNGSKNKEAMEAIADQLKENGTGDKKINFRLRDWGISRQRYWGAPIPIIYCKKCGIVPVPEKDLPILLPEDIKMEKQGGSPLEKADSFKKITCPACKSEDARRETDTMDTFVESSWYFERYCSPHYKDGIIEKKENDYWMPVDQYIGGVEHAVLHLLYARYFTRVLNKFGFVDHKEPFANLLTQGMVCKETHKCAKCGFLFPEQVKGESQNKKCAICGGEVETGRIEKMSKSKKNVIEPSELISEYGADTTRLFCLFAAPPERDLEWSKTGVEGGFRFINRVFRIVNKNLKRIALAASYADASDKLAGEAKKLYKKTHVTIARVTNDIENRFHFNTAISAVMELVNALYLIDDNASAKKDPNFAGVLKFAIETAILLLAPIVPHVCEELWQILGHKNGVTYAKWPKYLKEALAKDEVQIVAQVNGKIRSKFLSETDIEDEKLKEIALADERVLKFINNKPIKKVIVVKNKLVNIVV